MDGGKAWFARRRLRPPGDQLLRFGGGDRFEAKRGGDAGPVWQEKKEASGEEDFFFGLFGTSHYNFPKLEKRHYYSRILKFAIAILDFL
jgi:hypothetical protein